MRNERTNKTQAKDGVINFSELDMKPNRIDNELNLLHCELLGRRKKYNQLGVNSSLSEDVFTNPKMSEKKIQKPSKLINWNKVSD